MTRALKLLLLPALGLELALLLAVLYVDERVEAPERARKAGV